jgi:NAD(P)H-nitrite reductase large subunit
MQNEIVCYCSKVTKQQILEAIKGGAKTLQDIRNVTNACTMGNCQELNPKKRCCSGDITQILNENTK